MDKIVQVQEEKLRRLSIEYDEELYPHLMSTIAERRYVFVILRLHNISCRLCFLLTQIVFVDVGG